MAPPEGQVWSGRGGPELAPTPPFELLDLVDGGVAIFTIVSTDQGPMMIRPNYAGAPLEKEVQDLRVNVMPSDKPAGLPYYDITSGTLRVQLTTLIQAHGLPLKVKIKKVGEAPSARFQVERVLPPAPAP